MQVGADAVVEMAAPPPARAPDGAQANANERSFDDHLDAATPAGRAEPESQALGDADKDDAPAQADEPDDALALAASAPPPPSAQPALIQILASFAAATPAPDAEATPAPGNSESAPPTTRADIGMAALAPHAVAPAQPKSAAGDTANAGAKANASMTTQSDGEAVQPTPPSTENEQPAPAAAQTQTPPDGAVTAQTATPTLVPPLSPQAPPPATNDTRRIKAVDAPKAPIAPANAGNADASAGAGAKPNAQGKAAPAPAAAQTAPPRENFALLLAQHEAPQPASALPVSTSSLMPAHATPVLASADSAGQVAPAVVQVSREIIRRFNGESTRFELRLDPPELGRVEIRLEVSRDHRVTATVGADSPQALAELSRHARDLEQALQSAGLELTEGGLSFDLSDRSQNPDDAGPAENRAARDDAEASAETGAAQRPARPLGLQSWRGVRVDLVA